MSKLMSGIDWIDVSTLMKGLEGIHELRVELIVTVPGTGQSGSLDFTVLAWVPTVEAHHTEQVAKLTRTWPNKVNPTFEGAVFAALYDLDREIGRAYKAGQF